MTNADRQKMRERALSVLLLLIFIGFVARLAQIQLFQHDLWQSVATLQSQTTVFQKAARGEILDSNGWPMAVTLPLSYAVGFRGNTVPDKKQLARTLSPILGVSELKLYDKMKQGRFVYLARRIDMQAKRSIEALGLTCFQFDEEPRRTYPGGPQAAAIIGFADVDGRGREGIECSFDSVLSGEGYSEHCRVDALRKTAAPVLGRYPDEYFGADVTLTIDTRLQTIVDEALKKEFADRDFERVCAILIRPQTGDILALSTLPTFDPNNLDSSTVATRKCWPITDLYEPGSTLKILPVVKALETGRVSRRSIIDCGNGSFRVRGATIHDAHPYDVLTMDEVLAYSSNIGAAKIGMNFTPAEIYDKIRAFGFGNPTFVELAGEPSGLVPKPKNWSGPTLSNLCYGHGLSCTALQLAMAYACVANGGVLMKPRLISLIEHSDGRRQTIPVENVRRVLSPDVTRELTSMLENVISYGTAKHCAVKGVRIAAKTGTAQKVDTTRNTYYDKRFVSSLVGFFPADNPQYTLLILVDDPRGEYFGGTVAGPTFKNIIEDMKESDFVDVRSSGVSQQIFSDAGPDKNSGGHDIKLAGSLPVAVSGETSARVKRVNNLLAADSVMVAIPLVEGWPLRQALQEFSRRKLNCTLQGTRVVVSQEPAAGTLVSAGTVCVLRGMSD